MITYVAAVAFPFLFIDDFIESAKDFAVETAVNVGTFLVNKLKDFGGHAADFANTVAREIGNFFNGLKQSWATAKYGTENSSIKVNMYSMRFLCTTTAVCTKQALLY